MPMADCATIKDFVKHDLRVRLVRKLTMENAGVHKPFVKEMYDQRIYYGEPVEVFCRFYVYFTLLAICWLMLDWFLLKTLVILMLPR